ncbi:MAG: carbohydrate kinase [Clostridia bacterium]|nr:carbohydrate kinase [Clostridia bacterium]
MYIGGLDIGTTGCKLSVYDDLGEFAFNSYREYEVRRQGGTHEIDPSGIFDAVCQVIREACASYELTAIGVTSFGESFVALDERDEILLPAMLYTDPRGEEECRILCDRLGEKRVTEIAGVKPHTMYSLPKMMWIRENLPEVYGQIKRLMLMEDYVVYSLCGVAQIDYSLAARTMAFDIREKCWSAELLAAAEIDESLLSRPVPTGSVAGKMKKALADALGVKNEIVIVSGAHDQVASAVGAGVLAPGEAVDGTGTVECVTPVFDRIPEEEAVYAEGYSVVPYVFDGTYVCYALSFTGGATLKWFRDNFAKRFEGKNVYAELDRQVSEEPTGILVLPHFAGAANPYMDNGSRAAMIGLTIEHTAADLYKALMEGVTYEIMTNIEHLESAGICPDGLYATGGGASSDVWMQIKADILGRPVTALRAKEVGACGTCMLAGVATGIYKDLEEAKKRFVKVRKTYFPRERQYQTYQDYYKAYRRLYDAVRPIVEELRG